VKIIKGSKDGFTFPFNDYCTCVFTPEGSSFPIIINNTVL